MRYCEPLQEKADSSESKKKPRAWFRESSRMQRSGEVQSNLASHEKELPSTMLRTQLCRPVATSGWRGGDTGDYLPKVLSPEHGVLQRSFKMSPGGPKFNSDQRRLEHAVVDNPRLSFKCKEGTSSRFQNYGRCGKHRTIRSQSS